MKWRFEWCYRLGLAVLFVIAFWSVWAGAQETNNVSATTNLTATTTNAPGFLKMQLPHHALTFGLDGVDFLREQTFLEQPLWKYCASFIYILLAFCVAWLLDLFVVVWLKKLTAKTQTKYDDLLLELLRGPVKVVAFVVFLNIGLNIFEWPDKAQTFLSHTLLVVVACSVTYVVLKFVDLLLGIWREKIVTPQDKQFAEQLIPLAGKSAKVVIVIATVLLTADNLGINIKTLLAGLSVGGLALGLAAQDTVANLFGAVAIFLDKPFHIGDRIRVEGVEGTVETIGLRSTNIRNLDGHHVTIPNKLMGNAIITNITRRPTIKTEMNIGLTYDTPAEKVKRATLLLEEIFATNPKTSNLIISFNKFADSSLNILVVHFWNGTDAKQHFAEMQALNLQIKSRFDAEKIEFAFPSQTIYLKTEAGK
ncbi:MAG TPA: mechanosensitive ion channel family protein [Verrucomicrobiae bacterium]